MQPGSRRDGGPLHGLAQLAGTRDRGADVRAQRVVRRNTDGHAVSVVPHSTLRDALAVRLSTSRPYAPTCTRSLGQHFPSTLLARRTAALVLVRDALPVMPAEDVDLPAQAEGFALEGGA